MRQNRTYSAVSHPEPSITLEVTPRRPGSRLKLSNRRPTIIMKIGVVLFPGFQITDAFGPYDTFYFANNVMRLRGLPGMSVCLLADTDEAISSMPHNNPGAFGAEVVPSYRFTDAPDDIDVLLVPGGQGVRAVETSQAAVDFIKSRYPTLKYLLTVCTGAVLAARSGVLDGRRATSNKRSFDWVCYSSATLCSNGSNEVKQVVSQSDKVNWVREARWVIDGNIYTSSGVSAGIDMAFGFVRDVFGEEIANVAAHNMEYMPNKDANFDPFVKQL